MPKNWANRDTFQLIQEEGCEGHSIPLPEKFLLCNNWYLTVWWSLWYSYFSLVCRPFYRANLTTGISSTPYKIVPKTQNNHGSCRRIWLVTWIVHVMGSCSLVNTGREWHDQRLIRGWLWRSGVIIVTIHSVCQSNHIKTEYYHFALRPLKEVSEYLFSLLPCTLGPDLQYEFDIYNNYIDFTTSFIIMSFLDV